MALLIPLCIAAGAGLFLLLGAIADDRRARILRWAEREGEDFEAVVPLLHSINDDRCIGCEACVDVCPTKVLDLVDHKVAVARFGDCVQCEQCANACPTQALVMYREGTTPRMLTVPELDDHFQTAVPGQYLIGEVAGKPLVKNAANLGRAVVERIARDLAGRPPGGDGVVDVIIVGSGPGGLSAGLTCRKLGLSYLVLEKEHVISSTVSRYPKGKHFMAEPCSAANVSYLPVFDATKEDLVAAWRKVVDEVKMPIKLGEAVDKIERSDEGVFTVKTTVGKYRSRTVVLATGLRGKPRLLAVPGANLEKVQALLDDPGELSDQDVLVVGGGDSAVEGAMSLVDAGARVTLSYRGDGFKRCKPGNQKRLAQMTDDGRLALHLESNVTKFTADHVEIKLKDGQLVTLPNQRAFVLIGADTPVAWLETVGVRFVERPHLYALGSTEDAVRKLVPDAAPCPSDPAAAVALLLGKPVRHRARSVMEHLVDDFVEVVTSVSGVFHLGDEGAHRSASDVHAVIIDKGVQVGERIIPAARLLGRAATPIPVLGRDTEPLTALGKKTSPVAAIKRAPTSAAGDSRATRPVAALRGRSAIGRDSVSVTALGKAPPSTPVFARGSSVPVPAPPAPAARPAAAPATSAPQRPSVPLPARRAPATAPPPPPARSAATPPRSAVPSALSDLFDTSEQPVLEDPRSWGEP